MKRRRCLSILLLLFSSQVCAEVEDPFPLPKPAESGVRRNEGTIELELPSPNDKRPGSREEAAEQMGVENPERSSEVKGGLESFFDSILSFYGSLFSLLESFIKSIPKKLPPLLLAAAVASTQSSSPIVLDLNENGEADLWDSNWRSDRSFNAKHSLLFDIDGDGELELCEWMKPNADGLLVFDKGQDGWIAGQRELFGNGEGFDNGYEKLQSLYDEDGDGVLRGEELSELKIWLDDGDARSTRTELYIPKTLGIVEIDLRHDDLQSTFKMEGRVCRSWDWWSEYIE